MHIHIYTHMCMYVCVYIYIYTRIEREMYIGDCVVVCLCCLLLAYCLMFIV